MKWNVNVVDFCIAGNYIIKIMGLALNYSDLLYFPCNRWLYLVMFICNQIFLITYWHPVYHGSLFFIRKIVMRPYFDNCRRRTKRFLDKAMKMCRGFVICKKYLEKCENCCKVEAFYEIDNEKEKEITKRFSK